MVIQEARFNKAMSDLNEAQAQLDAKQKELDAVQAMYDAAMAEKQVIIDTGYVDLGTMLCSSSLTVMGLMGIVFWVYFILNFISSHLLIHLR